MVGALLVAPLMIVAACSGGDDDARSASTVGTARTPTSQFGPSVDATNQTTTEAGASTVAPSSLAASAVAASSTSTTAATIDATSASAAAATTTPTTTVAAEPARQTTIPKIAASTSPPDSLAANPQAQAPVSTDSTAAPAPLPGGATCDGPGTGGYDLRDLSVERRADALVLTVRYVPIDAGHDVWIGVTADGSTKRIVGELFEDGSGVSQVQDLATSDTVYLDSPLEMTADHTRLVVPRQSVDAAMLSGPLTAELKVDGPSAEICSAV